MTDSASSFAAIAVELTRRRNALGSRVALLYAAMHDMPSAFSFADVFDDVERRRQVAELREEWERIGTEIDAIERHFTRSRLQLGLEARL